LVSVGMVVTRTSVSGVPPAFGIRITVPAVLLVQ
jgi:hypothetical protein